VINRGSRELAYFSRRLNISFAINALETAEQAYGPELMK
jgi:hypothetical protein